MVVSFRQHAANIPVAEEVMSSVYALTVTSPIRLVAFSNGRCRHIDYIEMC